MGIRKDYEQAVYCYNVVKDILEGVDTIYSDSLIHLIGTHGFYLLHINGLIEVREVTSNGTLYKLRELPCNEGGE